MLQVSPSHRRAGLEDSPVWGVEVARGLVPAGVHDEVPAEADEWVLLEVEVVIQVDEEVGRRVGEVCTDRLCRVDFYS